MHNAYLQGIFFEGGQSSCFSRRNKMKILLINPSVGFHSRTPVTPLGLLSIATYLKERGYVVRMWDRDVKRIDLQDMLADFQPDVIGISVISAFGLRDAMEMSKTLRMQGLPVVWGGAMPSTEPRMVLQEGCADYVVISEGEMTFHELLTALEKKTPIRDVAGIAYLNEAGEVVRTPERPFADLAELPVIDWSFVDPTRYFQRYIGCQRMIYTYNAKGCPAQCTFCFNQYYHKCRYRKRPNEFVLSEIRELIEKYGADGIYFADEMFGAKRADIRDFCESVQRMNLKFAWGCQTRVGQIAREDLQMMYDAGCRWMFFGVESGNPEILKKIKKGINFNHIEQVFYDCREVGIATVGSFILDFPKETYEQIRDTVHTVLRLNPTVAVVNLLFAFPGTAIYDEVVENGMLSPIKTLAEWSAISLEEKKGKKYSDVPTKDLYVIQSFFNWQSFFHKNALGSGKRFDLAFKAVSETLQHVTSQGIAQGMRVLYSAAKLFFHVFYYRFAFPKILRKYDLHKKNFGRNFERST